MLDTLEYPYFVKLLKGHGYDKSMDRYYAHQIKPGLRLIGLDACLPDDPQKWGGMLPKEQISWLDKQLTENKNDLILIMIHHNLVQRTADELAGGPKQWFTIGNANEERELLAGHPKAALWSFQVTGISG